MSKSKMYLAQLFINMVLFPQRSAKHTPSGPAASAKLCSEADTAVCQQWAAIRKYVWARNPGRPERCIIRYQHSESDQIPGKLVSLF